MDRMLDGVTFNGLRLPSAVVAKAADAAAWQALRTYSDAEVALRAANAPAARIHADVLAAMGTAERLAAAASRRRES